MKTLPNIGSVSNSNVTKIRIPERDETNYKNGSEVVCFTPIR